MRILHTSDWHIGQKIYEQHRLDEHSQFLYWLLDLIREKNVDVLLVSGDIFDTSLPAAEATDLYYRFLFDLYEQTRAHAVIIAGNHDSAVRLSAPARFLKMARIHIVGGIRGDPRECVVCLDVNGMPAAFAAVPYINEGEILSHIPLEGEIERSLRYREAIRKVYEECMAVMPPDSVRVLLGHYFLQGGTPGDSERLVRVGDMQPFRTSDLPGGAHYVALGHLHSPQQISGGPCPIVYSGSPLPMSFKEALHDKQVFLVDIDDTGTCDLEEVNVPVFRQLIRVEGDLSHVMTRANFEDWNDKYIEVRVHLDDPGVGIGDSIRQAFAAKGGRVLVVEPILPQREKEAISADEIRKKSPAEIFQDFYHFRRNENGSPEELKALLETFNELLETFNELLEMSREAE